MIVQNALSAGKYAIFADCGMGKTLMQLVWANNAAAHTGKPTLVLCPLSVVKQTQQEAASFGIDSSTFYACNYEQLHNVDASEYGAVVLDESSIIKNFTAKTLALIMKKFDNHEYKLACTATPSPNDHTELGNHAEFLGVCTRTEMLANYFINDTSNTKTWRLKGHAKNEFYNWVASWATMITSPADMGCDATGYSLPNLKIETVTVECEDDGSALFATAATTLTERREARKGSMSQRVEMAANLASDGEQWIMWCDFNAESEAIKNAIPGSAEIKGSTPPEERDAIIQGFKDGQIRVLVTKPSIAGMGVNLQNCHKMAFVGISDSYEQFYQAVRRSYRYGQKQDVKVFVIISERETPVIDNIKKKQESHHSLVKGMVGAITQSKAQGTMFHSSQTDQTDRYEIHNADCVEFLTATEDERFGFSVFSPPFRDLFVYSEYANDMGNAGTDEEFNAHYRYFAEQLFRTMKEGRNVAIHCMNLTNTKWKDGFIGVKDFRGDIIRLMQGAGFIYHSEVVIWKDPVTAMQRTKALGLLHKQIRKDSAMSRQGLPDYLVIFRKPGENKNPIAHTPEEFPVDLWQKYASPVWMDINQSNTLQRTSARDNEDEKHVCPLQLDVIRRALYLWSNPGDLVYSPFMGIGSEGYVCMETGRRFVGTELKPTYYHQAKKNLDNAVVKSLTPTLF